MIVNFEDIPYSICEMNIKFTHDRYPIEMNISLPITINKFFKNLNTTAESF